MVRMSMKHFLNKKCYENTPTSTFIRLSNKDSFITTIMKLYRIILATVLIAGIGAEEASALPDSIPTFKVNKISITPSGRLLLDGAAFTPSGDGLNAGVAVPDVRLGVKVNYDNWNAKIDVGYGFGKISMKDVYMQYTFNDANLIRGGYFVHQFGLQSATSSSMKPSMEAPTTDNFFQATGRNLGIMYVYDKGKFFAGVSAIIGGTSLTTPANEQGKVSYGGITRLVYRPWHSTGLIGQIGISGWIQSAMHKAVTDEETGEKVTGPGYFNWGSTYPTRVCKTTMMEANVDNASNVLKLSPEILLSKGRVALEGQYYYMNVKRKDGLPSYKASGAYGLLRGILIGGDYGYSHADAGLATPAPKSLEVVLGYNYTDGNDSKAGIYGGRVNDASLTLNYYINKYMLARLRYSFTELKNCDGVPDRHVNIIQARLQFKF